MEQLYYIFDEKNRLWIETKDLWVTDDIEKYNLKFLNSLMSDEELLKEAIKKPEDNTLLAYLDLNYSSTVTGFKNAVARWRIQIYKEQKTVIVLADTFNVMVKHRYRCDYKNFLEKPVSIEHFSKISKQFSLRLDYGRWKYTAIPFRAEQVEVRGSMVDYKFDWAEGNLDFSVQIPSNIVNRAMGFLQEMAREEFGFNPTVPSNMPGDKLLKYFVQYPLDVSVGWYVDMLGFDFYSKVVRKNQSNADLVCDYLQLPKTKGIKKVYHENPEALIICYFLKEIGIEDINVWQYFFDGKTLMGVNMNQLGIDRNGEFYFKDNSYDARRYWWDNSSAYDERELAEYIGKDKDKYNTRYVGWHLLYSWLMDKWGAKKTGEILRDVLLNIDYYKYDCLRLWLEDYRENNFPEEFVQAIYRYGISREAHDLRNELIRQAVNHKLNDQYLHLLTIEFKLNKVEMGREEETALGSFRIARSGRDLYFVSENMHNCVFRLYTKKMQLKACTIYYLQKDEEYLACIEVIKGTVVQAYGKYNKVLAGDLLETVTDWCVRNDLTYAAAK